MPGATGPMAIVCLLENPLAAAWLQGVVTDERPTIAVG